LRIYTRFRTDSGTDYFEPDISVICDKGKLDDKGCNGAPDLIIEVVSPSSRKMDYFTTDGVKK
jgi:Uma2 family endonuclease